MSTLPGDESWRDAGLVEDDEADPTNLVEEAAHPAREVGEDYHPGTARPDLDDLAGEADVVDQSVVVPDPDGDPDDD